MADASARFQLRPDVVTHDIDEGLLVVDLDSGKTWKLNHVGAAICRGFEEGADIARIVGDLATRYGVAPEAVQKDVDALVESLREEALVTALPSR